MLYTTVINIGNRSKWGSVYQYDVAIPNRIKKITGIFANVIPSSLSKFRYVVPASGGDVVDAQVGVASVSINNTDIVMSSIPLMALDAINGGINKNIIRLSEPKLIKNGSLMRVVIEEKLLTPFVNATDDSVNLTHYFAGDETPTNSYSVKIYIEYA